MTRTSRSAANELDERLERWLIQQIQTAQADLNRAPERDRDAARRRYDTALECWADFVAVRTPAKSA